MEPPSGSPPPGATLRATWPQFCEHVTSIEITIYVNGAVLGDATINDPAVTHYDFYAENYPTATYTANVVGKVGPISCSISPVS